jgi:RNA polymerase sigma-70 factor (ECF subfamily)
MADLAAEPAADDTSLGHAFDRAWARSLLVESARLQGELAGNDERRRRRVELLRLRFHHGRAIREIAADWGVDAATLHHEYAAARAEFRQALLRVIAFQRPTATAAELDQAARELLKSLA